MDFSVKSEKVQGITVVRPVGRLVLGEATDALQDALEKASPPPRVVLDMSRVPWVDSSGIGTIVRGLTSARKQGGEMRLCGLQSQPIAILMLTQVLNVVEEFETEAEALAAFDKGAIGG